MASILVLDANAFSARGFAYFLRSYRGRKILPAVAAAELYRHLRHRRGWGPADFLAHLRGLGVEVEPLDAHLALAAVEAALAGADFGPDDLIAAHALAADRLLVTSNLRDFPQVPVKATPAAVLGGGKPER